MYENLPSIPRKEIKSNAFISWSFLLEAIWPHLRSGKQICGKHIREEFHFIQNFWGCYIGQMGQKSIDSTNSFTFIAEEQTSPISQQNQLQS